MNDQDFQFWFGFLCGALATFVLIVFLSVVLGVF